VTLKRYSQILFCFTALLAEVALFSCASGKVLPQTESAESPKVIIKEIDFEGIERFKKEELLEYLHNQETSWWAWTIFENYVYYNEAYVRKDGERIKEIYHSFGYFETEVDVAVVPIDEDETQARVVYIVKEGSPVTVEEIIFSWASDVEDMQSVNEKVTLVKGEAFEVGLLNDSKQGMLQGLQSRGYALAKVTEEAEVSVENKSARVRFNITAGPFCTIGNISYEGLRMVRSVYIDDELDFVLGKHFSPELLRRIEATVYAMDVFDSVAVSYERKLSKDGTLPLKVSVVESRSQRLRVGPGLGFEPNRWEGRLSLLYTHKNIFGDLTSLNLRVVAGYAFLPYPWQPDEHGPVFKFIPTLRKKGWLEKKLVWTIQPQFELNVDQGYQYYTPKLRFGVSRFLWGITLAEVSYNFHYFDFFDVSPLLENNSTLLGKDFRDPYILSYLEFGYTIFLTDRIVDPQNGLVFKTIWDQAGTVVGGHFDYHKLSLEARGYWKVFSHLQVALRAGTGYLWPYAWRPGVPLTEKLYLGGANTVRGWGLKRLSPQIEDCDDDNECEHLAVGGKTMLVGNAELRFLIVEDFYIVPFLDMGDVQEGEVSYTPEEWNYSTGGGMRYDSPIGKFRLDFGWRLNDPERFSHERRWAIHFSLGEAF